MLLIIFMFKNKRIIGKMKLFTKFSKTSIFITATLTLCGIMFTSMSTAMAYSYVRRHHETVRHLTCYENDGSMRCTENNIGWPVHDSVLNKRINKLSEQLKEPRQLKEDSKVFSTDKQLNKQKQNHTTKSTSNSHNKLKK